MSNKELAVQLYCAKLQTFAALMHKERQRHDVRADIMPTPKEMIADIKLILSALDEELPQK